MTNYHMPPSTYKETFDRDGFVCIRDFFTNKEVNMIAQNAHYLYDAPEVPGKYMKYHETVDGERQLARVEYFIKYYEDMNDIFRNKLKPFIEMIIGEKLNILKDKLNWKLAGGDGFKAHQDQPAWSDFPPDYYVSLAIFADDCTVENGCLEMVRGKHRDGILDNDYDKGGGIKGDIVDAMLWEPVLAKKADIVIFDSYVPHKSEKNTTNSSRRIFYFTFNKTIEGDYYEGYFIKKREEFPPDVEKINGKEYNNNSKYNLANPISHDKSSNTKE
jgi:2-aminoethylphosphonate dioxygenase